MSTWSDDPEVEAIMEMASRLDRNAHGKRHELEELAYGVATACFKADMGHPEIEVLIAFAEAAIELERRKAGPDPDPDLAYVLATIERLDDVPGEAKT